MALSYIVCEIQQLIDRKSRNLYTLPAFSAPPPAGGDPVGISRRCLILVKNNDRTTCGEETMTIH